MRPWQGAGWCPAQAPGVWSKARPLLQGITRQAKTLQGLVETEPLTRGVMLARDCEALGQIHFTCSTGQGRFKTACPPSGMDPKR